MSQVFISYRRADTAQWAGKLHKHLSMRFGKDLVFQDVDDIKPGADFLDTIRDELASCRVFLILIGPHWLIDKQRVRRLDDPDDVLGMEVAAALAGEGTVIPLLFGGASMPSPDELPARLQPLSRRQAVNFSAGSWPSRVEALIDRLRELILPRAEDIPLPQAERELYELQRRYFDLLDSNHAADALELAQRTQAYLDRVLPLYPHDPRLKVTRGYLYKNEAMALNRLGRHDESNLALARGETVFSTMLDERRDDAGAWNGLGSIEAVRGNFELAHRYVDEALKLSPAYPAALQDHALILERLGLKTCKAVETTDTVAGGKPNRTK